MNIGKRVKSLLQEHGQKQIKLIRHLLKKDDIEPNEQSNFSRYLTGKVDYPRKYYPDTASFFDMTVDQLLNEDLKTSTVKMVPIRGTASCGACEPSIYESKKKAYYNGDFFKESLYCVIACGESMAPEIDDGDEVIIDPDVKPVTGDMVYYKLDDEAAIKVLVEDSEAYLLQFVPYNSSDEFKTRTIRMDDEETMNRLTIHKVVSVNKLKFNNRLARLKMIGRG